MTEHAITQSHRNFPSFLIPKILVKKLMGPQCQRVSTKYAWERKNSNFRSVNNPFSLILGHSLILPIFGMGAAKVFKFSTRDHTV